jgi:hypothetical protein
MLEPGINKPFDRIAKEFAEEAPRLFLRLLGIVNNDEEVDLEPLRPETAPSVTMPDYVATLRLPRQAPVTFHVEFFVRYRDEIPAKIARYGGSLAWQYQRPVRSVLFLMQPGSVPLEVPETGEYNIGGTKLTHPFRTVKLWELDAAPLLESGNPGLLPWALLTTLSKEEAFRMGAIVAQTRNEEWVSRFLWLGSLRYPREELQQMLGGPRMGFVEALLEGSSLVQEARDLGEAKGQAAEARRLLRLALSRKFPGLESLPEIDLISDVRRLEALLLDHVMFGVDAEAARQAIRNSIPRN